MRIVVLDAETSLHNEGEQAVGELKAAPFHPCNWVVWIGLQDLSDELIVKSAVITKKFPTFPATIPVPTTAEGQQLMVVGHGIKFDLEFLCSPGNTECEAWREAIASPDFFIWDTMQAEFRLCGQSRTQPSLEWVCKVRGWEVKPGRVKEYQSAGVSTEGIPDEEVQPHLEHGITMTVRLFQHQVRESGSKGMMPLMRVEMDAITATCCMEVNGMYFNKAAARTHLVDVLQPNCDTLQEELAQLLAAEVGAPVAMVNPLSNPFLTSYFYGGAWKWQQHELMYLEDGTPVLFKTGKHAGEHKAKIQKYNLVLPRRVTVTDKELEKTYTGVDEGLLNKLVACGKTTQTDTEIIRRLLELRELKKLASTYFDGYSKLVWPDGMIRTSLNHAIAATARLTSSAPNLQNAGHNEVRSYFQSRYEGGHLLEVDLVQIEIVAQAFLSQDPNMMRDIEEGIDFHCKRAALTQHMTYDEMYKLAKVDEVPKYVKIRQGAKEFSFQRAYGAGVNTISDKTGLSRAEVKAFISAEEAEYPEITVMQDKWIAAVAAATKPRHGVVCGELVSCTGARYRFARELFRGDWTYKPTMIKNYPIQGLAGEIMKIILSEVRKYLWKYNHKLRDLAQDAPVLMANTVHDSVVFDLPAWVNPPEIAGELIEVFTTARQIMSQRFGLDFNLPIRADAKVGVDWFNMETVKGV